MSKMQELSETDPESRTDIRVLQEKAKAYDEALEKARQLCAYPTTKPFISDLQDLFPELKESEDEKIRGKIIATIHLYYGEPLEDEAKEMIAWLEKQKREEPSIADIVDEHFWEMLSDEKQGEQKPAEWTPMDEQRVENLLAIVEGHGYPGEVAWLNSLKNRVQPKQEWSEKDEKIKERLINSLAIISANTRTDSTSINYTFSREIDWLKSLRPQIRWKPSDEQMEILKLSTYCKNEQMSKVLFELHQDLKKLREE